MVLLTQFYQFMMMLTRSRQLLILLTRVDIISLGASIFSAILNSVNTILAIPLGVNTVSATLDNV